MPVGIDPMSDTGFKYLFATKKHLELLLSFLQAVLCPAVPIVGLELVETATRARFPDDDVTIVDVAATDANGRTYQIEVQLQVRPGLRTRMLYAAADVLQGQLQRGSEWHELRPLVVIWLLGGTLFPNVDAWRHTFTMRTPSGLVLAPELEIHVVELPKWRPSEPLDDLDRWAYFLREAATWDDVPPAYRTPALEKAMAILRDMAKTQELFEAHRRRMAELDRNSWQGEIRDLTAALATANTTVEFAKTEAEAAKTEAEAAKTEAEAAKTEAATAKAKAEAAEAQAAALLARLRAAGLEP